VSAVRPIVPARMQRRTDDPGVGQWERFRRPRTAPTATLREAVGAELARLTDLGERSRMINLRTATRLFVREFGDVTLAELATRRDDVEAWFAWLATQRAGNTVRGIHGRVHGFLERLVVRGVIASNPARMPARELPSKQPQADYEVTIYTPAEVALLWHHPVPERRMAYRLVYGLGLRAGELAMEWRHVDFGLGAYPLVRVEQALNSKSKRIEDTKTGTRRRIPAHVAIGLEAWRDDGWRAAYGRAPTPSDFVVPHMVERGKTKGELRAWPETRLLHHLKLDARDAGLRPSTLRDARHWFVSQLTRAGADRRSIQRMTHTRERDVIEAYTHLDHETLSRAIALLPVGERAPLVALPTPGPAEPEQLLLFDLAR
jgi:hypothetical protein